ncbi:solute carrier family 13 member 5-like [Tropilaelaps mercedesae]|uniref:Solute carrier family 13 member 5-like n=1 Tax=Tropilaelaps mercedesae TaxID=418985 RepID=A0A1V9XGH8_9ACAR|nr:solute carrier family 13 member 5-like [Tropilaelaps mercedesae]
MAAKHTVPSDGLGSHPKLVCFLLSVFAALISGILANVGMVTILVSIFAKLAEPTEVNPLLGMMTPTIAPNLLFLLPVDTPAKPLIYENVNDTIKDFLSLGPCKDLLDQRALAIFLL